MNEGSARDEQSTFTFLGTTAVACSFAMRRLMQKLIRVVNSNVAVSIMHEGRGIRPLRLLRDQKVRSSVELRRHQDRLNRALGQADVAGLRAVRPAGFITEMPPKVDAPHCSRQLVALAWRMERAERLVPMPFTITPATGKSFRSLLPAPAPEAAQPQSVLAVWIRRSPATWLPEEIGLKPAVASASRQHQVFRGVLICGELRTR